MNGPRHGAAGSRGFTLVEVLVALMIVAIGLAALMLTVSSTARTSGTLRDKTLAQWMALNRLTEVRLNLNKFGQNTDTGVINFGNRTWHYDTRYFDTSIPTMKRVVVRVYAGDAKIKGNAVVESTGFTGSSLGAPGSSNLDWTIGSTVAAPAAQSGAASGAGTTPPTTVTPPTHGGTVTPAPNPVNPPVTNP